MKRLLGRFIQRFRSVLGDELTLFFGYALIVFRPGAFPPQHPGSAAVPVRAVPDDWTDAEYQLYIEEARLDSAGQQEDKRDIRTRAQIILTTALLLGGFIVASYEGKDDVCTSGKFAYLVSATLTALAALSAGGIITAKSAIGAPNLMALPYTETGGLYRRVADEYAYTREEGMKTVAVLVTVLRDSVLALILGALVLAAVHVWV